MIDSPNFIVFSISLAQGDIDIDLKALIDRERIWGKYYDTQFGECDVDYYFCFSDLFSQIDVESLSECSDLSHELFFNNPEKIIFRQIIPIILSKILVHISDSECTWFSSDKKTDPERQSLLDYFSSYSNLQRQAPSNTKTIEFLMRNNYSDTKIIYEQVKIALLNNENNTELAI